jgi:GTP-binding protein Era
MPEDEITDQTERTLAAEIVREKVFVAMRQEVPFSTAVLVEEFEDDVEGRIKRIRAAIVVERDAHKAMVIGAGAQTLKKIGIAARLELEKMLDSRIHLALNVRVDRNWTRNPSKLEEYGL